MQNWRNIATCLALSILLAACGNTALPAATETPTLRAVSLTPTASASPSPTWTASPAPSATPTLTPLPSPTPTATPSYPLGMLHNLPPAPPITRDNLSRITPLMEFDTPLTFRIEFSDNGKWMLWYQQGRLAIYDTETFTLQKETVSSGQDFGFVPGTDWVILHASVIWDLAQGREHWRAYPQPPADLQPAPPGLAAEPELPEFITISSDGKRAANDFQEWDLTTLRTRPRASPWWPVAFSPNGERYAVGRVNEIDLFDQNGQKIKTLTTLDWNPEFFFSQDGKFLTLESYTSYGAGIAPLWVMYNAQNGTVVGEIGPPLSYHIQPRAKYVLLKGDDPHWSNLSEECDWHIYRVWPRQKLSRLVVPASPALCQTHFHPDYYWDWDSPFPSHRFFDALLVTITRNEKEYRLNAWNVETGALLLDMVSPETVFLLSAQKDGQWFAFYKPDSGRVEIYDAAGTLRHQFDGLYDLTARKVIHSSNGQLRALVNEETITVVDLAAGSVLHVLRPDTRNGINDAIFLPDSERILTIENDKVWLYDARSGALLTTQTLRSYGDLQAGPGAGQFMVIDDWGKGVYVYDSSTFRLLRLFSAPGNSLSSMALSPDGKWLATGGTKNRSAFVYNVERGTVRWELPIARFAPNWMQFSPDGKTLYVGDLPDGSILYGQDSRQMFQVWDMQTGRMTSEVEVTLDWLDGWIDRAALERERWPNSRSALSLQSADMLQTGDILLGMTINFMGDGWYSNWNTMLAVWRPGESRLTAAVRLPVWSLYVQSPFRILIDHRFVQIDRTWWGVRP